MIHTYTTRGNKRYRYYVCSNAQKRGWDNCPSKSVPAGDVEQFVVDRVDYDGSQGALDITFRDVGIKTLAEEASPNE